MLDPGDVVAYTEAQGQYIPRSKRLLMLARDLANGWYTVEALAQRYDVCERTIYRDIADLQDEPIREPLRNLSVWKSERCR
jgi:hypothetical protein